MAKDIIDNSAMFEKRSEEEARNKPMLVAEEPVEQEENQVVPTIATQAVKILHPILIDPDSGRPLPPPPDHEFRLGVQVSITTKGRVLQEAPGLFFVSGSDINEIAEAAKSIILQGLEQVKAETSPLVRPSDLPPGALDVLDRFGQPGRGE